ncbi:uncharacterized protein si:dkey-71d15.2 isoform X2 [Electrophorus electricus]|uniref:uncharacterized protein si:dkey-71d15.2 isoform X2 n=1 Tax=Electrophorus electricus TaxID=8005 RepID=UPI0015D0B808|nr:uncharacterized protein si:dkey-71d15.2 isoform X2 [Electrophorus electricus]
MGRWKILKPSCHRQRTQRLTDTRWRLRSQIIMSACPEEAIVWEQQTQAALGANQLTPEFLTETGQPHSDDAEAVRNAPHLRVFSLPCLPSAMELPPRAPPHGPPTLEHLQVELQDMREELQQLKSQHKTEIKLLMNELDEEKKKRLSMQVEVERIKKHMSKHTAHQ